MVHRLFRAPDGTIRLLVQGLARFRLEVVQDEPYLKARSHAWRSSAPRGRPRSRGPGRNVRELFQRVAELVPSMPGELLAAVLNVEEPRQLVYTIATYQRMELDEATRCWRSTR